MNNYDDSGISLTPTGKRVALAILIAGILLALAVSLARADSPGPACQPTPTPTPPVTSLRLTSFAAVPVGGNAGGCAAGNKINRWPCVVTDFTPGRVSGTCDLGFWFRDVATMRTFRLDQPVNLSGCLGMGDRITSVPGTPVRIGR